MKKRFLYVIAAVFIIFLISACTNLTPNNPPTAPSNPSPANGTTDVSLTPTLSWQASNDQDNDSLIYDVYFGMSADALNKIATNLPSTSYTLSTALEYKTTYFWKVVAKDGNGGITESPVWKFTTIDRKGTVLVKAYNTGYAVDGASVKIKSGANVLATGTTNENGEFTFGLAAFPEKIDIEVTKDQYALSKVEGLKVSDLVGNVKEVVMKTAGLKPDPSTQTFPTVTLKLFDLDGNELNPASITDNFLLRVDVESDNDPSAIYAKIGMVPGAGFLGPREYVPDTKEATFTMDVSTYNGEQTLYVVFYDYNNNRVEKIEYLTINRSVTPSEQSLFVPINPVEFGFVGLIAYTRNQGVEFNSNTRDAILKTIADKYANKMSRTDLSSNFQPMKSLGKGLNAAPKGTNLWVEVSWIDYDTLDWSGLVGPNVVRPDGYNVYRSFDGVHYQKVGSTTSYYLIDFSAQNAPSKKVWYAVSSYKGTQESRLVYLGSVVPIDSFNVNLKTPADRATNVSRQPEFVWEPTVALTSPESDVEYHYTMWIYDLVQSENFILPGILDGNTIYTYDFVTNSATEVSVTYKGNEGSPEYQDLSWFLYLPDGIYLCDSNKLEPAKTYDWGIDYAYAMAYDNDSIAMSIAIDAGWGIDPIGSVVAPEVQNEFTTGN
ncbi:MAG TPA: hypothetical protein PK404_05755 [Fervidobacterium sp.]|nr:hypothetical protein [Fervidobacterium sp.]HOM74785.1 hypothetical protein [Fervidobacterium sp.]HOQ40388.1 hypothetical protein [Fervidobacterium sp.]HPP18297.1 hypothetical protein [Fervidobacterium sp.]